MGPKAEAAARFAERGGRAVIAAMESAGDALAGPRRDERGAGAVSRRPAGHGVDASRPMITVAGEALLDIVVDPAGARRGAPRRAALNVAPDDRAPRRRRPFPRPAVGGRLRGSASALRWRQDGVSSSPPSP